MRPSTGRRTERSGRSRAECRACPRSSTAPRIGDVPETETPWLVIVWNDPINLMSYVTYVFQKLFGYSKEKATKLMLDTSTCEATPSSRAGTRSAPSSTWAEASSPTRPLGHDGAIPE